MIGHRLPPKLKSLLNKFIYIKKLSKSKAVISIDPLPEDIFCPCVMVKSLSGSDGIYRKYSNYYYNQYILNFEYVNSKLKFINKN
jgi:hypothetical protein